MAEEKQKEMGQGEVAAKEEDRPRMRVIMPEDCPAVYGDRVFVSEQGDRGDISYAVFQFVPEFGDDTGSSALKCQAVVQIPSDKATQVSLWALEMALDRTDMATLQLNSNMMRQVVAKLEQKLKEIEDEQSRD